MYLLSRYIADGTSVEGTILSRVINIGISPLSCIMNNVATKCAKPPADGIIDSLRFLIHSENYIKPWSVDHLLVKLFTKAF